MDIKKTLIKYRIIPTYTEISLFLILYGVLLTIFLDIEHNLEMAYLFIQNATMYAIFFALGAIFTIYYAFNFKKVPSEMAKTFMIILIIAIEMYAAYLLFIYNSKTPSIFYLILAYLNLAQGLGLMLFLRAKIIDESNILPINAKPKEIIIGMIGSTILFLFVNYILKTEFPITFSILITYAIVFNELVSSPFLNQKPKS